VSRISALSMRARASADAQAPVRGYFLWVGGALLALLFATDSLLPAPLPSKLIVSHATHPPIRITSELKGPEAVVIDTSYPGFVPFLPDREIAAAPAPLSSDMADAVPQPPPSSSEQVDASDESPAISTHIRETLAQLASGVPYPAVSSGRRGRLASKRKRHLAQIRSEKRRQSAPQPDFDTTPDWFTEPRPSLSPIRHHARTHTPKATGQF
jgi:hypothetical protein